MSHNRSGEVRDCKSLEEVRSEIDWIDKALVALIAERGAYVRQAAQFKRTVADVEAPQRVKQVIDNVRAIADEMGANPDVVEQTWRAMITAFIESEKTIHSQLQLEEGEVRP